jgi:hypothetical protein
MGSVQKRPTMAYYKELSQHMSSDTDENLEKTINTTGYTTEIRTRSLWSTDILWVLPLYKPGLLSQCQKNTHKNKARWKADQKVTSVSNDNSLHAIVYTWDEARWLDTCSQWKQTRNPTLLV